VNKKRPGGQPVRSLFIYGQAKDLLSGELMDIFEQIDFLFS